MVMYNGIKVIRKSGNTVYISVDKDIQRLINVTAGDFVRITVEKVNMSGDGKDGSI